MKETPILFTERLYLRPFLLSDVNDVYEWCSSFEVTRFLFWYPHRDKAVTERLLKKWIRKKRHYSWCVEYEGKAIGEIEVIKDLEEGVCEIGYTLNERYWRKGIMKEGVKEAISFLFSAGGYQKIVAFTDKRNLASKALLSSLGFIEEGERPYRIEKKKEDIEICSYFLKKNP